MAAEAKTRGRVWDHKDECAETGNATPKKKPAFFNEVDELLSDNCCQLL